MPCCKAEEYEWCKDLPSVYTDDEGKEYCVFHAPQGKKKISLEEFNKLIFKEINQAKKSDTQCTLDGTVFEGSISFRQFDKDNPLPEISFEKSIFNGEAYFGRTIFSKKTNFVAAIFNGKTHFWKTRFIGDADFFGTIFGERANFKMTTFSKKVNFTVTTFSKDADFFEAAFNKESDFNGVTFTNADFHRAIFTNADFGGATFEGIANFNAIYIIEKIKFEGVNLSKHSFIYTDLTKIDFINCEWHRSYGRNVLYDEICLFRNKEEKAQENKKTEGILPRLRQSFKQQWADFLKDISCDKEEIKKVEILYRQLKRKCKEEHNEVEISDWHYGEKEMFRKGNRFRRFFPISLSNLYWFSSGYGERPARAGIGLILLILAISILFGFAGLNPNPEIEVTHINGINDLVKNPLKVILNTLQYVTFEKDTYFIPQNIWGTFLKIFAKLFIPLQAALFAFSVRNRFKR